MTQTDKNVLGSDDIHLTGYVWVCRTEGVGTWEPSYFENGVECAFYTKREAQEFLTSWDDTDSTLLRVHVSETARQEMTL